MTSRLTPGDQPRPPGHANQGAEVEPERFPDGAGGDPASQVRLTYQTVLGFGQWPYNGKRIIVLSSTIEPDDDRVEVARTLDEAAAG